MKENLMPNINSVFDCGIDPRKIPSIKCQEEEFEKQHPGLKEEMMMEEAEASAELASRQKMNWKNLINSDCPKCGRHIFSEDPGINCSNYECDFFITQERFQEICKSLK